MISIYKITNPNGSVYIGQSWNTIKRFYNYRELCCKRQILLYRSFLKYGVDKHNFEIIYQFPEDITQEIIDNYEIFYIKQYKDCNIKSLNIREGGSRGKHTEESKIRMSKPRIKRTLEHIENNRIQRMKPILRLDLNNNVLQEYDNLIGAVGEFGQGVSSCLSGKLDSFFNYKWKYKYTLDGKGLTINKYKNLTDKNNSVIQILSLVQDKKQVL